ncbi:thymine dioxygenase [Colletotrichum kahawae]|uniref:Thymine dioxygenase n=1 Tax=Colletotrichum kahawae TaxID=34407 RepID=A0AAD9XXU2_COLKA|nr:thymine dioxygenase [Colletotrichum kahawae]
MADKGATLDMSLFFGTPEEKKYFCTELLRLLKLRGGVKIQNHSIPDEDIHKLFDMSRKFFALPLETKMEAKHPPQANPNRGYSFIGQENVANISGYEKGLGPGKTRDIKETLDMGSAQDDLVDNLWIPEESLPGFRGFMESFYEKAFKTEMQLLSALAIALGVSEDHMKTLHNRAENEFRLLHYPAIPATELADGTATRIAEHTDFGTITMLFQDSVGGLQVEDQTQPGVFRSVESSKPTDIILNIGDSLQRLTNDTFRAACHRVTYPPAIKAGDNVEIPERYSIAYFVKPNRHASLLPLKEFITDATPCRYEDVTAWEWNNRRITKLFG